ncbi:hypothetical protein BJ912DRAFT_1120472 [Pholiota molesta]|nr:hypothetical protein BJ912DRAFT_1120472 [Pholiota molesta]
MADLIRSAKQASEWTQNEIPAASDVILNNVSPPAGELSKWDRQFFSYLREAESSEKSALDDFAVFILSLLRYDWDDRFIRTKKETTSYMGGKLIVAQANVSLLTEDYDILLIQNNKHRTSTEDPEPKLIADCIAAFAHNHSGKYKAGLPTPKAQTIVGISMIGTAPIFYRLLVAASLLDDLVSSTYPAEKTVVLRYIPSVPNQVQYQYEGMRPLDNRRVVFQCFEALKGVVLGHKLGDGWAAQDAEQQ